MWARILVAHALAVQPSQATTSTIGFEWDAPAECPTPEDVAHDVESRLRAPLSVSRERRLDVIARVRRGDDGRWALRVWFIGDEGTRRRDLVDADCALLAQAAATVIAVNIDALSPRVQPEPEPEPEPEAEPEPAGPRLPSPPSHPLLFAPPERTRVELRLGAGPGLAPLPKVHGGFSILLAMTRRGAHVEIGTTAWFQAPIDLETSYDGRASYRLFAALVRAGYIWVGRHIDFSLTAGVEVGAMVASTKGLARDGVGARPWLAFVAAPTFSVRLHPNLALFVSGEALGVPLRPRFEVEGFGEVHRAPAWGVRGLAGLRILFGREHR